MIIIHGAITSFRSLEKGLAARSLDHRDTDMGCGWVGGGTYFDKV